MKPLKSKFDNYHSLPPVSNYCNLAFSASFKKVFTFCFTHLLQDISLAKVKLEEARRELVSLILSLILSI